MVWYNTLMINSYFNKCTIPSGILHLAETMLDYKLLTKKLLEAIKNNQLIVNVCDTDADGLFSGYVYRQFAIRNKITPKTVFAERSWGYGITQEVVNQIPNNSVVITSDVGITTGKVFTEQLRAKGCTLLITDHHLEGDFLPDAYAIVNPNRHHDMSVIKQISGTVVLSIVLIQVEFELTGKLNIDDYLIPMAITTISDVMPLNIMFNRLIVKAGLKLFSSSELPFVQTMLSNIKKLRTAEEIAFQLVPRLNVAYRLSKGRDAFKFLDLGRVEDFLHLDTLNAQRKELVASAVEQLPDEVTDPIIFYIALDAPKGILGLIASKLVDKFNRPAICLTRVGDKLVGSGRSSGNINLFNSLTPHKHKYLNFGGHHQALGIGFLVSDLEEIKQLVSTTIEYNPTHTSPNVQQIELSDITTSLVKTIAEGEPYGQGYPRPLFETTIIPTAVKYYGKVTQIWVDRIVFLDFTCSRINSKSLTVVYAIEDIKTCLIRSFK